MTLKASLVVKIDEDTQTQHPVRFHKLFTFLCFTIHVHVILAKFMLLLITFQDQPVEPY